MNIKLQLPKLANLRPRITVVGVGGAGSNAVNNMIASGLTGVTFAVANTDAQSLANSSADRHIQLGAALTEGLGAGARPEIGKAAAEEALEEIRAQVEGSHMVFVAAGMGGGTGTGAAAVIARVARECGALTVGVVTKPFQFEGTRRMRAAEIGVSALKPEVDTLIVIPNQNLFRIANERTTFADAFRLADQVLYSGIACVVDLIVKDGLINLDFADVRTVMSGMGTAMMGTGEAAGDRRAVTAAEEAISNPLLDDISLRGARGLLVSITGNRDMTLYEVDEAANRVRQEVDPEATIIVGATFDDTLADKIRVSIVASGMERLGEQAQPSWPPARVHSAEPVQAQPYEAQQSAPMAVEGAYQHPHPDQHMPQHPAEPAPGMRYAHDDAGLTRALSEALGMRPGPDQTAQPGHHAPWASQSGAVFAEAPAQLAPVAAEHHGYAYPDQHAAAESHGFSPQAPADAGRSPRRLPQVEDFPVVGQRDYNAKIGQYADPHAPAPPRAYAQPAPEPPPRKLGFFERLTGVRRRTTPGPAPANTPQAPYTHENHHRQSGGMDRTAPHERDQSAPRHAQDHVELPVFFGGGKK